ncbi:MAG: ATP-binding protein [Blastocatellia bacterium]
MAKKHPSPFDPRRMMEKAVEVMRQSVPEHRADGSPSPSVGSVLVRPDGSMETAARGELRDGNHAEFILLERKCPGERLDGSILFTTLEPCLNRNHPKSGCARHILSARIKEVYVGLQDDNPTVAGKGIEHLRQQGVTIRMFDRDLQETIFNENKAFFEWARKQTAKPVEKPIKLSKYEDGVEAVEFEDLSPEALDRYREKAGIAPEVGSAEFRRLLRQQGLLVAEGESLAPSGFGLLLFGKRPRNAVPQAGLLARADLPDGKSARREFGEALVLIPGLLEEWLNTVLPSTIDRSGMERREQVDLPFEMIREAVVNALIHRDYDIAEQKCQLEINANTITVKSPGGPIPPVTLQQLQSFRAPMKSRNPVLHYVFARMGMAEEQGFGLEKSLKRQAQRLGLPLPAFAVEGDYLVLTMYRHTKAAVSTLPDKLRGRLSKAELAGWEWLAQQQSATSADYSAAMSLPARTALNHLKRFVELGLVRKHGSARATRYEVRRS